MNINEITIDHEVQSRHALSEETISEYVTAIKQGAVFPPVIVFQVENKFVLADGFHRVEAFKRTGRETISSETKQGTKRDAILYSISSNATHGLRRTIEDKRRSVTMLLSDPEWRKWSDCEIARRCAVSFSYVAKLRKQLFPTVESKRNFIHKTGKTVEMDISKMRRSAKRDPLDTIPDIPEEATIQKESNNLFQLKRIWMRASALNRKQFLKWIATQKK